MSKILIVHAHLEPKSLTSALKDHAVKTLTAQGHEVKVSDLYQAGWNPVAGRGDFTKQVQPDHFQYGLESGHAYAGGTQAADIVAEQEKLVWADAVLFSFSMWWFGMPAILKGWIDRVYALGLAYGVGEHNAERWGDRYGEGNLSGRRGMLIVTLGGHQPHYSPRGVNGSIDDILWPIQHGMLFYPGMEVMPPFLLYHTHSLTEADWPKVSGAFEQRLKGLFTDEPIPFRAQNGGHYDARLELKPELGAGETGTRIHLVQPGDPEEFTGTRVRATGIAESSRRYGRSSD
ncbi:MAG TPA: NAD(P)H-dependent oxidoreductase [Parvibaculum sp.]